MTHDLRLGNPALLQRRRRARNKHPEEDPENKSAESDVVESGHIRFPIRWNRGNMPAKDVKGLFGISSVRIRGA